jgi:hypothetical protein
MDRWGRGGAEEENFREKRGKRREVGHKRGGSAEAWKWGIRGAKAEGQA